ncbi:MAG TPA: hypothetical protein PLG87_06180 [Treponemataceae bacterium]|jgi:hypothetical protein|nr:hypothetical protein [Treponemataceae bacterium]
MKKLIHFLAAAGLVLIVLLILFFPACTLSPSGITILDGDYSPPLYIEARFSSSDSMELFFTEKILQIEAELQNDTTKTSSVCTIDPLLCTQEAESVFSVPIVFNSETEAGFPYTLFACAKDEAGNTLNFSVAFSGFNNRMPPIMLNEVRTEYTKPKVEFVEMLILEDGNIGGLVVYNAYDGEKSWYIFPSVEVKKDEILVLHYRTLEEGCRDEYGSLDESLGTESNTGARDFWVPEARARIGLNDVILVKSSCSGKILDALLISESGKEVWKTEEMERAAKSAYESGAWSDGWEPKDAVCSDNVTTSRTLSRQKDGSWITTASGGASPGKANAAKPYVK